MGSSSAQRTTSQPSFPNSNPLQSSPTLKSLSSPEKSPRPRLVRFSTSLPSRPRIVRSSTPVMNAKRFSSPPAPILTPSKRVKMSLSPTPTSTPPLSFQTLPAEIRVQIYHFALAHDHPLRQRRLLDRVFVSTALLRVSRQIHDECTPEFYRVNSFAVHPHEMMGLEALLPPKKLCRNLTNLVISITPDNLGLPAVGDMFILLQRKEFEQLEKVTMRITGFPRGQCAMWTHLEDFVKSLDWKGIKLPRPTLTGMDDFPGVKKIQGLLENLQTKPPKADSEILSGWDLYDEEQAKLGLGMRSDQGGMTVTTSDMEVDEDDEGPVTTRMQKKPNRGQKNYHGYQRLLKKKEGLRWILE